MVEGQQTNGNGNGAEPGADLVGAEAVQSVLRTLDVLLDRQAFMKQAGFQFEGRRDLYAIFGYDRLITARQMRDEYARGGIAKTIVDTYPEATWRGGVEVFEDEDPKKSTEFEKAFDALNKKHRIFFKLHAADVLAQLSTYSVILIGAPGKLDEPLPRGNPDNLLYLQPFWGGGGPGDQSRGSSMRATAMDTDVTIATFETNPEEPRFGDPLTYRIRRTDVSSPMTANPVHWSRVIHIPAKGALDSNVYGPPALEVVWNLLFDLEKITGGMAESFFQRAKHVLHANIDKDVSFSNAQLAELKNKLDEYQNNLTGMIPTRGVDLSLLESTATKGASLDADAIITQIAGTVKIPKRILTGSERGQLASDQDADNFDNRVKDRRTGYAEPVIARALIDRLVEYGYLPTPEQYEVGWPVEDSMNEGEKGTYAVSLANVNKTNGDTVFTDDEIRDMAFDMEPLSDEQRAQIADRATEKLQQAQEAMAATAQPQDQNAPPQPAPVAKKPALRAAEAAALLRDLEAAIEADDLGAIGRLLSIGEQMNVEKALAYLGHGVNVILKPDAPLVVWINARDAAGDLEKDTYESLKAAWDATGLESVNANG